MLFLKALGITKVSVLASVYLMQSLFEVKLERKRLKLPNSVFLDPGMPPDNFKKAGNSL